MIVERWWPADPTSVPQARRFVTDALSNLAQARLAALELMVSELVTNAVTHTHTPFTLRLVTTNDEIRIEVSDQLPGTVAAREPAPSELHGRGLQIVQALADRWGSGPSRSGGKTVWFSLSTPA